MKDILKGDFEMENLDQVIVQDIVFTGNAGLVFTGLAIIGAAGIISAAIVGTCMLSMKVKNFISDKRFEKNFYKD